MNFRLWWKRGAQFLRRTSVIRGALVNVVLHFGFTKGVNVRACIKGTKNLVARISRVWIANSCGI